MRTFSLLLLFVVLAVTQAASPPKFPLDWSSNEVDNLLQLQGDYTTSGNNICCSVDSLACQIQVQTQSGLTSFDYSHNRTRFDGDGQVIVNDYNIAKEMLVVKDGDAWKCTEYCPLDPAEFGPFGVGENATYIGQKVIGNITTADWQWNETIFKVIVMEISDLYVATVAGQPVPVQEIDQLTPFGQPLGTFTSTWTNFTPGTPDPSLFNVIDTDTCPESGNCGENSRQIHRLRMRQPLMFMKYYQQAKHN